MGKSHPSPIERTLVCAGAELVTAPEAEVPVAKSGADTEAVGRVLVAVTVVVDAPAGADTAVTFPAAEAGLLTPFFLCLCFFLALKPGFFLLPVFKSPLSINAFMAA